MKKVVVVGLGAQSRYVYENFHATKCCQIVALIDIMEDKSPGRYQNTGIEVFYGLSSLKELLSQEVHSAIVCCPDPIHKQEISKKVVDFGFKLINAIHPKSVIASDARIGNGLIINAGAIIQPNARLDDGVMVHSGVIIEHDNEVGEYANLAPGVTLAGWVSIGKRALIYTGVVVIPQIKIGSDALVGAGSLVLHDVPDRGIAYGSPAKFIGYR